MLPLNINHVRVPPIKCQGIKTKLINFITTNISWNGEGRWVEPFLGSGVVLFNVQPERALVADSNPHIIKFYQDIQNGVITPNVVREFLFEQGQQLEQTGVDANSYYYEVRRRFNENPNSLDFLFLSRACFNGVMRFNKKGGFNVPFCKKPERFRQAYITKIANQVGWVSEIMYGKDWIFLHQDWRETLNNVVESDFMYLDPPYIGRFADYFNQWTEEDANDLATITQELNVGYALSMWASSEFRTNDYLEQWHGEVVTQGHFYHMGATENLRNQINEALVISPNNVFNGDVNDIAVRGNITEDEEDVQLELI
ncbi:DNA adenine methylase [Bacillus pumilus]|uniref:DNA adenine methylase n=1 Tax=Bacillus pumilus TaxID=1408 RepID=UPI0011A47D6A|nr:Dam family site-specific DNA-(adenine-N6)-methyltransferase [Bacillus pumilus]QHQ74605.1 Dam family site-specific DNA-(adenine-N6)-methyltransferase [Bacillus pumilus]